MVNIDYSYAPPEKAAPLIYPDGLPTKGPRSGSRHVKPQDFFVATPDRNEKRSDYTGAFRPEAIKFCQTHGVDPSSIVKIPLDIPHHDRGRALVDAIDSRRWAPKVVALFCHGYTHGLQLGIWSPKYRRANARSKSIFSDLMDTLSARPNVNVILYACSTGDDPIGKKDDGPAAGDNSLADLMRDHLCDRLAVSCRVVAHTTAGHTTKNPMVKFFDGNYSASGGSGAALLANPGTKEYTKLRKAMHSDPNFRFRFPFMRADDIHRVLGSIR